MTSFSPSFSSISFSHESFSVPPLATGGTGNKKRKKFRNYITRLARDFRNFFRIKPAPEQPPLEKIPEAQPPKTVTILAKQPETIQEAEQIPTINDKWVMPEIPKRSVIASAQPILTPEKEEVIVIPPPIIKSPDNRPVIQKMPYLQSYRVADGSHIESEFKPIPKPKPKLNSRVASILVNILVLSEMEAMLDASDSGN